MAITRTLYVGQTVQLVTGPTGVGGYRSTGILPVSSATCEVTRPIEAVTAFGRLGALGLAQTNLTTCKSTIKAYLTSGAVTFTAGGMNSGVSAELIRNLTGDAVNGTQTVITVSPNGFQMSGILNSLGLDMALGGFGTIDLSFNGIGSPTFATLQTNATTEQSSTPANLVPVTTMGVGGGIISGCANSFKFSLDMPTDTLACLGDAPDGLQGTLTSLIATKPPYKTTISVEGFGVDVNVTGIPPANSLYTLGKLNVALPSAQITAKSFNNAVGTANATYNYTLEDTTANFS